MYYEESEEDQHIDMGMQGERDRGGRAGLLYTNVGFGCPGHNGASGKETGRLEGAHSGPQP
jgi:hypothetical protein